MPLNQATSEPAVEDRAERGQSENLKIVNNSYTVVG
jgi:hypothetical protein